MSSSRLRRQCLGCLGHCFDCLRPLAVPILFLAAIATSACFLPFARVNYSMHVIDPDDVWQHQLDGTPVPVYTTQIPLDVRLYGVCGQTDKLEQIQRNKEFLLEAGNHGTSQKPRGYTNRLQYLLDTKLRKLAVCAGEANRLSEDLQIATWVAAGLLVSVLLILAGSLSLSALAIHAATVKSRAGDAPDRYRASSAVEVLSESVSWVSLLATFVFTAFTWNERRSSNSSYGPGYFLADCHNCYLLPEICRVIR